MIEDSSKNRFSSFAIAKDREHAYEERKLKAIQKMYSEQWLENETSIVIKRLDQSMKEKDYESTMELKRTLLELERRADLRTDEESPENFKHPEALSSFQTHSFNVMEQVDLHKKASKSDASAFSATEKEYLEKAIMQNTKQYDEQLTIMLIGSQEVGKTSLINSWFGLSNSRTCQHTIGYFVKRY